MAELTFQTKNDATGKAAPSESCLLIAGVVKDGSDTVLKQAARELGGERIIIDCGDLSSMSSIGAANWLRFIADLRPRFPRGIRYERCPIFFVDYLNMFDAFREGVEIARTNRPSVN